MKSKVTVLWKGVAVKSKILLLCGVLGLIAYLLFEALCCHATISKVWSWFGASANPNADSNAGILRSIAIALGTPIAIYIAWWRSSTATRQQESLEKGNLSERYQKGVEMVGSDEPITTIGGITILAQLAKEHPAEFNVQVTNFLAKFLRMRTRSSPSNTAPDILDVTAYFSQRSDSDVQLYVTKSRGENVDLRGCFLSKMNLQNSNFANIDFTKAKFDSTDLSDANLTNSKLESVDFTRAVLAGANFCKSRMYKTKFTGAILKDARMKKALMNHANLNGANLEGANLTGSNIEMAKLEGAVLYDANLVNVNLTGANLKNAKLCGADLTGANLRSANLDGADLSRAKLNGTLLQSANLNGCQIGGAEMCCADLQMADLRMAHDLTQEQLDVACQDKGDAPKIDSHLNWDMNAALMRHKNSKASK